MNSKIAGVLRGFADEDLAPLRAHVDIRALPDDALAGLVQHLEVGSEARDKVTKALGEALMGEAAPVPAKPTKPVKAPKAKREKPAGSERAAGQKRTPEELAALIERVYTAVHGGDADGTSVEVLKKNLDTPTKDLTLPLKKLLAEKRITSKGQKRATRYFPKRK